MKIDKIVRNRFFGYILAGIVGAVAGPEAADAVMAIFTAF